MSALRKYLKRPETYLALLASLCVMAVADSFRKPPDQVTAMLYVDGVRLYQALGRPLLEGRIRCRYQPTCSDYSIEGVRRHGVRPGLILTLNRIKACTKEVRLGTSDPVPE
jgi:putative membrane protein insertion efficiency factor